MTSIKIFNKLYLIESNGNKFYARYYNYFWDELTYFLRKKYKVQEYRNSEDFYENSNIDDIEKLEDCDYLVLNEDTNEFVVFSTCDILHSSLVSFKNNKNLKKIFLSQFFPRNIESNTREEFHKFSPWIYFPCFVNNLDQYFYKRKYNNNLSDKLLFKGETNHRPIIQHFSKNILSNPKCLTTEDYFEEAIKYKVGLSISGRGEFCYRDVEYMALGIPFVRFQYQSAMLFPLVPNYHYISLDIPPDMPVEVHRDNIYDDKNGLRHHAEMLEEKFLEIKDDKIYLDHISNNARQYYEDYLSPKNNIKITLDLIEKEL